MQHNTEIRKLPAGALIRIIDILETNNDWKKVMAIIPKTHQTIEFEPRYNNEHIRLIEEHSKATGRKCAEILFDEWATSGKIRPTLNNLKEVMIKAEIYRAADEIAIMLNEMPPPRPKHGPAAPIDFTEVLTKQSLMQRLNIRDSSKTEVLHSTKRASDSYNGMGNKTTVQMKSASDLIKFSAIQKPRIQVEEPTLNSVDIPNFSAIMDKSNGNSQIKESTEISSVSESEDSSLSNVVIPSPSQQVTEPAYSPNIYQMSLPNIEFDPPSLSSGIDSSILEDTKLIHFEYRELENITKKFCECLMQTDQGLVGRIGSGGFGEVFAGYHPKYGQLAVKKAHNYISIDRKPDIVMRVFNTEVKFLSQFRHINIVPILGFSKDGPALCIVCDYIEGGSLEQKIAEKVLNEKQRIDIMMGTAEGLKYLHGSCEPLENDLNAFNKQVGSDSSQNSKKNNFVHGDVKSANILLTKDCIPKLCDFGLAKQLDSTFYTTSPMGTSAYMAPEGFSGTITQKIDIYSYGIVLLELLTGLKPIISSNSEKLNIKDYIEENCADNITMLLDPVTNWSKANEIYNLALMCLQRPRKSRPSIEDVCAILYSKIRLI